MPNLKYRPDIDGLRAVAVTVVVLFHAFPPLMPGGFIGVDIFFVISGFLITTIILKDLGRDTFSFKTFYIRRINRIFPPLSVVLIACGIFGWFTLLTDELRQLAGHLKDASIFLSNFRLLHESGYFDNAAETKPLLHLWSLAIEEQFYILWPFLLWLFRKRPSIEKWIVFGVGLISFGICQYLTYQQAPGAFYLPQSRFWELAAGGGLAFVHRTKSLETNHSLVSWVGVLFLAIGLCFLDKSKAFPGLWAALPVLGSVLIIAAGETAWLNRKILSHPSFVGVGLISYSIYLWHWPLLTFARIIEGETPSPGLRLLMVALTVVLATLSFYLLEQPLKKSPNMRLKPALLCLVIIFVGLSGRLLYKDTDHLARNKFNQFDWDYVSNDLCLKTYPFPAKGYSWWFCETNTPKPPDIMVLGNSFGNHIYPGLIDEPRLKGKTILSIGACVPVSNIKYTVAPTHPCAGTRPTEQENYINEILARTPKPPLVLLSAAWPSFNAQGEVKATFGDAVKGDDQITGLGARNSSEAVIKGLEERITYLERRKIPTVLFFGLPRPQMDIRKCIARPLRRNVESCTESVQPQMESQKYFREAVLVLHARHPALGIFDPMKSLCDKNECRYRNGDRLVFRDVDGHLSVFGSDLIVSDFVTWAQGRFL
jgi:peptidoglycan/LPS O-acetylase OafA/YrhL